MQKPLNISTATRPLSIQLPIFALLLSLTIAFAVSLVLRTEATHLVDGSDDAYLTEKNRSIQTVIEAIYQEARDHLAFVSLFPPLKDLVAKRQNDPKVDINVEMAELEKLFNNLLNTRKIYTSVRLLDFSQQKDLISVAKNGERVVSETSEASEASEALVTLVASKANVSDRPTLPLKTIVRNKLIFSDIQFNRSGQASFEIARPIYFDGSSELFGLIYINVDFNRFMALLNGYALNGTSFYLANEKGVLIYSNNRSLSIDHKQALSLDRYFPDIGDLADIKTQQSVDRVISKMLPFQQADNKIATLFQAYQSTRFGDAHKFGWIIQPKKSLLFNELKLVEKHVLFIAIGLALIALVLSFFVTKRIIRPLTQMIHFITGGHGDIERLPIHSKDEVGVLARAFYNMRLLKNKKNEQLVKARMTAEQAVLSKNKFFASMSHEIRTPMNGVLGMLGLIMRTDLSKQQKHYATLARSSADSLLTIIDDILDLSKIEAGKIELESLDFDLREQLGIFAEAMAYRAQDKGLEMVLDVTEVEQSMVKGDPNRVRQILANLVGNAIKFTEEGEVFIKASLHPCDQNEWLFKCEVSDTGIGVPADKIEGLFASYSQVDSSTTRKFGGTGLGLAIVKQLAELMNGQVTVTSEFGKGSKFKFDLRLGTSQLSKIVAPEQNIKGTRVLLVDDNPTNLEVLVGQLEHWQATVFSATNGQQALDILAQQYSDSNTFDIAILDMGMPDMDGAQLGGKIRANAQYNKLKLVMMTSMASSGDISKFKDLGFSAYFPKPATTRDLFHALQVLVEDGTTLDKLDGMITNYNVTNITSGNIFSNAQVLLVEDNPVNQEVALGILNDMGVSVDIAENGIQAIEKLVNAGKNYDLILMDCQMPEMDGYEASQQIRSKRHLIENDDIPIIAMTANALKGDRQKCLDAGMDDYLTKPVDPNELEKKLRHWLPKEQQDHHIHNQEEANFGVEIPNDQTSILTSETSETSETSATDGTSQAQVWDKSALMARVKNNKTLVAKLVDLFFDDLINSSDTLQSAVKRKDIESVKGSAHKIKGSAANLSAHAVSSVAGTIEAAANNGDMLTIEENINDFLYQVERLLQEFRDFKE